MKLFDYISKLFGSSDLEWEKIKDYDKSKNSFMTQRFMSIKYPIQANMFNSLKTNPVGIANSWRLVASKFNRTPSWIYTKVKKTSAKTKDNWSPNPEALKMYSKLNEIGMREFELALKMEPTVVKASINKLEKQMHVNAN